MSQATHPTRFPKRNHEATPRFLEHLDKTIDLGTRQRLALLGSLKRLDVLGRLGDAIHERALGKHVRLNHA